MNCGYEACVEKNWLQIVACRWPAIDSHKGSIPNANGKVVSYHTNAQGKMELGMYVLEWLKTGPNGVIGANLHCVDEMGIKSLDIYILETDRVTSSTDELDIGTHGRGGVGPFVGVYSYRTFWFIRRLCSRWYGWWSFLDASVTTIALFFMSASVRKRNE